MLPSEFAEICKCKGRKHGKNDLPGRHRNRHECAVKEQSAHIYPAPRRRIIVDDVGAGVEFWRENERILEGVRANDKSKDDRENDD